MHTDHVNAVLVPIFLLTDSEHPGYLTVKLFSKDSHLCDHNPPTLQTDGQTTYYDKSATALRE